MSARIKSWDRRESVRGDKHAARLDPPAPSIDPRVLSMRREGYSASQIASVLRMSKVDVLIQINLLPTPKRNSYRGNR